MVTWICSSGGFGPTTRAPGTSLRLLPGSAARLRDDEFAMMNQRFLYLMTAIRHRPYGDSARPMLKASKPQPLASRIAWPSGTPLVYLVCGKDAMRCFTLRWLIAQH